MNFAVEQQVVGYGWRDGVAELRFIGASPLLMQGRISLMLLDRRQCIGWRGDAGPRRACPTRAVPSGAQCLACSRREGFWACMTCDGFDCPPLPASMLEYCRSTHVLYLACFGGPTIKVGTASAPRRIARLIDQGPLAAAHIASGPGPVIKQLEAISVQMGYLEALRRSRKWQEYRSAMTEAQARQLVLAAYEDIAGQLVDPYRELLHEPRFVDLPGRLPMPLELVTVQPGHKIVGQVVAARGHICVLDDGAGRFAIDLGAFRSWFIELDPVGGSAPVRQLGLFG